MLAGQISDPVHRLLRAVVLALCPLVHGCVDVHGGAVELSWKLRAATGSQETFLNCGFDLAPGGTAAVSRQGISELDLRHEIIPQGRRLHLQTHFGLTNQTATQSTRNQQVTWKGALQLDRELNDFVRVFGGWSREEASPSTSTGRWVPAGGSVLTVAPEVETRTGGQLGMTFETRTRRLRGTIGAFHESVSGQEYRDWSWESSHSLPFSSPRNGEIRMPFSTSVARDFVREGWTGSLSFNPLRSLTTSASWSVDWKDQGPYRGGNRRATALVRYDVQEGRLKHLFVSGAIHFRNDLLFDDGFVLRGGWRTDAILGYWLRIRSREIQLRLNVSNLADRSWQLTRFAPDHGRQVILSVSQEF